MGTLSPIDDKTAPIGTRILRARGDAYRPGETFYFNGSRAEYEPDTKGFRRGTTETIQLDGAMDSGLGEGTVRRSAREEREVADWSRTLCSSTCGRPPKARNVAGSLPSEARLDKREGERQTGA
jgi:hypothetical protein